MDANITNRLTPLVDRYNELVGKEIPDMEEIVSKLKASAQRIMNEDIPLLLAEYGLSEAKLVDGTVVSQEICTEVSQAGLDKEKLMVWLTLMGYSSSIKDVVSFDKGEWKEEIGDFLAAHGYSYSRDSSVHSQTLKKVIKDHLAAGGDMPPDDAVKVTIFERGVVKAPKNKPSF